MRVVAAVLALHALLDHADQQLKLERALNNLFTEGWCYVVWGKNIYLVTKVALGGLGVGVDDPGVRDLGPVGHLHLHPGWPPCNAIVYSRYYEYFCCMVDD